MTPPNDIPWERLVAWLGDSLSPAEEQGLTAWIAEDPAHEELVTSLREIWLVTAAGRETPDVEAALAAMKLERDRRLQSTAAPALPQVVPFPRRATPARWAAAAAAAAVLAVGGWWALRAPRPSSTPLATTPVALREYATARSQRAAIRLPDGSAVVLAPESRLRYAAEYGQRERVVELSGEAQFEVRHDATRPFSVIASYAVARDLGTRFVVRGRPGEPVVVAVATGRVAVGRRTEGTTPGPAAAPVSLAAGDVAQLPIAGATEVEHGVALDRYFGWTEGRLVFRETPLARVVGDLARWYDVDIQLRGTGLDQRRLTAAFDEEPVDRVLASVAASFGLRVQHDGRRYTLFPK
jgi:transmembrane sensor